MATNLLKTPKTAVFKLTLSRDEVIILRAAANTQIKHYAKCSNEAFDKDRDADVEFYDAKIEKATALWNKLNLLSGEYPVE